MHVRSNGDHASHESHALHACHPPTHYHMHDNTYIKRGKENKRGIKRNLEKENDQTKKLAHGGSTLENNAPYFFIGCLEQTQDGGAMSKGCLWLLR